MLKKDELLDNSRQLFIYLFLEKYMGRVAKGIKCSVEHCNNPAVRSLSMGRIGLAMDELDFKIIPRGRRVYLCREHYRKVKKVLKKYNENKLRW